MATSRVVLRIDTPAGQLIVREGEVAQTTAAKLILPFLQTVGQSYDFLTVEEQVACLRGEAFDHGVVLWATPPPIRKHLKTAGDTKEMELVCQDRTIYRSRAMMMRRFQLVDDYLTDNPTENSLQLPFTAAEVVATVGVRDARLAACYDCLSLLNPKSNLVPFLFDLTDVPYSTLLALARKMTETEKTKLLDFAYKTDGEYIVPERDVPYTLGIFPSVAQNLSLMKAIFYEKYPSYLFMTVFKGQIDLGEVATALLTWDFSSDEADAWLDSTSVRGKINGLLSLSKYAGGPSTLQGLAEKHGVSVPAVLPYGVSFPGPVQGTTNGLKAKLATLRKERYG